MTVPAVLRKKEKKILITLNAFEDEQSSYKAGCGQMWLTGGHGPIGVDKWVDHTNSLSWDVKKNRAHVYPYLPIMTACCMLRANWIPT